LTHKIEATMTEGSTFAAYPFSVLQFLL